ncbi:MAG TPA: hypothetical protein VK841_03205, partial [Polyangiaceae bacterium]|nr:hypothetical protein [Polyangiaceae bacterium]
AAGFALDLDRLGEALHAAGVGGRAPVRVVVVGPPHNPRLAQLRGRGIAAVASADRAAALAWARAWGFTHVADAAEPAGPSGADWLDAVTGAVVASPLAGGLESTERPAREPQLERIGR